MGKISELKINDRVQVVYNTRSFGGYVNTLDKFIGCYGIVDGIGTSSCNIRFDGGAEWRFPRVSLRKDIDPVIMTKFIPNRIVSVCNNLDGINYSKLEFDGFKNIKLLEGKNVTIINNFEHKEEIVRYGKIIYTEIYIGVLYDGDIYYLPTCALYENLPVYKPRIITKKI